ncbi:uncharacterized protein LOC101900992 isoform X2 [Musca domestica]|nr:uncharacterized protein LOC101900992 isoform X2 [Musca domestica]
MKGNLILVLAFIIFGSAFALRAKITRVECKEFDKAFASITKCYLKALSRYKSAFSLYVALHQVPVDNVTFNAALFRKGNNGYCPFMYNHTVDFCRFYKNPNRFMFWKIVFFNIVAPASNINHTCPYDHDIILEKLVLDSEMFKLIPFPADEYMVRVKIAAYNHYKAEIRAYIQISE